MVVRLLHTTLLGSAALAVAVVACGCRSGSISGAVASAGAEEYGTLAERGMASRTTSPSLADRLLGHKTEAAVVPASHVSETKAVALDRRLNEGHELARQGRIEEARVAYQDVLRRQPNEPVAHHRLGVIGDQQQDYVAAEEHYLAALRTRPTDADLLSDLGYSYLLQGRYEEAEKQLSKALKYHARHERATNNLALVHVRCGEPERALAVLRGAATEADAQRRLAVLLREAQNSGMVARASATGPAPLVTARNGGVPGSPTPRAVEGTVDDLRQALQRERQKTRAAGDVARNSGGPVAPDPRNAPADHVDPRGLHAPNGSYVANPPRVPDARLNEAFTAIDDGSGVRQPPAWPYAAHGSAPQDASPAFATSPPHGPAAPQIMPYGPSTDDGRTLPPAGTQLVIAPRERIAAQGTPASYIASAPDATGMQTAPNPSGRSGNDPGLWPGDGRVAFVPQPASRPTAPAAPQMSGFSPPQFAPQPGFGGSGAPSPYGAGGANWDPNAARRAAVMGLGTGPGSLLPWVDGPNDPSAPAPSMPPYGPTPQPTASPSYGPGPSSVDPVYDAGPSFAPPTGLGTSGAGHGPQFGPAASLQTPPMQPPGPHGGWNTGTGGIVPAGGMQDGSGRPGRGGPVAPAAYATPAAPAGYVEPPQWPGHVASGSMPAPSQMLPQTQWPTPGNWSPPAPEIVNPLGQVAQPADPSLYRAADGTAWSAPSPALTPRR